MVLPEERKEKEVRSLSRTQVIADEELAAPSETRKMKARETSSFICQQEIVNGLRTKKRLSEVVSKTKTWTF